MDKGNLNSITKFVFLFYYLFKFIEFIYIYIYIYIIWGKKNLVNIYFYSYISKVAPIIFYFDKLL